MKVALVAPDWGNSWIPLIKAEVERRGHEFRVVKEVDHMDVKTDVWLHAWAASSPCIQTGKNDEGFRRRNVMFMRRFELFSGALQERNWELISDLILVNSWIKDRVDEYFKEKGIQTKTHLIYNAVDTSKWTFKERKPNHRIGMACHVHPKKNLPLALEVLCNLPMNYELHIAGEVQDGCTAEYLNHIAKKNLRKVYIYGHIPREQLNSWWDQMGFCLSTSISEGNPNNVLEAMAKGIPAAVLNWPGANAQFSASMLGDSAAELAGVIKAIAEGRLNNSQYYRDMVERAYSLDNIRRAVDIALNP